MTTTVTPVRALVVTGGHPFEAGPFAEMLAHLEGVVCEHVERPGAAARLSPATLGGADVVVLYDMPGIGFRRDGAVPDLLAPSHEERAGLQGLLAQGTPLVILHHAIASWPGWEGFAEIVGGRFHYVAAELRGRAWPDSGYRFEVAQHLSSAAPGHPVLAGLDAGFDLTDETYCCPVFEDDVLPLLRTDAPTTDDVHWSSTLAVTGRREDREGWHHPPGSDLAAWATSAGGSPVVYLQPGDGPTAYGHPAYRRLLANATTWVASPPARAWALERARPVPA